MTGTTQKNIDKVHKLVKKNRKITVAEIEEKTGFLHGSIVRILKEHLHMKKVCSRWLPKKLTQAMKDTRVKISSALLSKYNANPTDFDNRIVTCDETWVYQYDPESKRQSMEWKHLRSPPPVKFRVSRSTKKLMATIFWDCDGVIHVDYLPRGSTMNGAYYAALLKRMRESLKEKRRGKLKRGVLLQQDNAPVHNSKVAIAAAKECKFEIISHPPYSPEMAPSDYHMFGNLKKFLRGRRFEDDSDMTAAVDWWIGDQPNEFFRASISDLPRRWAKCVRLGGDYVEN